MWIGATPRAPGREQRRPPNGHHLRVGPPPAGPPEAVGAWREEVPAPTTARAALARSLGAWDPIGDGEAAAFAARFAADYLSFDEDDPTRRAEVLRGYLADPSACTLGWSGIGRQRCDIVLPGRALRTEHGVIVVEVTARIVPYRRSAAAPSFPVDPGPGLPPVSASTVGPSCAPAPAAPGWVACPALWVRIAPPVRRDDTGALVIDLGLPGPGHGGPTTPDPGDLPDRDPASASDGDLL